MIEINYLTQEHYDITEEHLENYLLQSGAIWISGCKPESVQAQVMHFDKNRGHVFCIQKINFGYKDIAPDTYMLDNFLKNFTFMGVKR